jgi:two-component system sensor histidine kinase/response regulator
MAIHKPKLLIVDDKPENLLTLEVVLKELDVEIIRAMSGNEALKATLHHDFVLALLDIQMPEMDGYELASILREEEKTSRLPFIFISAVYTSNLNVFKGYEQGAFSFITKPFQPEILINKVKFFIEKHEQEAALFELNKTLATKNEELETSNKELESFSYTVSHDLRAPLRALDAYSKILGEEYAGILDDEGKKLLGSIQSNAKKMGLLVDSLLAFSKLGKQEMQKSRVNMNELVESVLKDVSFSIPHKASIKKGKLLPASADLFLLHQVWVNLISNALKYSSKKEKPEVEIGSSISGNEITYYVKDNGAGFNMKYANKLFGVFQRLHSANEFEGTGIGLAIVHRIITRHGGNIWAEAEIDKGATISFTLPEIVLNEITF